MSSELQPDLRLQIGHVPFIDIVGYSKLLINAQSELLHELNEVVRGSEQGQAYWYPWHGDFSGAGPLP